MYPLTNRFLWIYVATEILIIQIIITRSTQTQSRPNCDTKKDHSFMQTPVHLSFGRVERSLKIIDNVSKFKFCHMCVFVVHFRSKTHFKFVNWVFNEDCIKPCKGLVSPCCRCLGAAIS